jgi:hypothetical protein
MWALECHGQVWNGRAGHCAVLVVPGVDWRAEVLVKGKTEPMVKISFMRLPKPAVEADGQQASHSA